jgi:hypothetical protein
MIDIIFNATCSPHLTLDRETRRPSSMRRAGPDDGQDNIATHRRSGRSSSLPGSGDLMQRPSQSTGLRGRHRHPPDRLATSACRPVSATTESSAPMAWLFIEEMNNSRPGGGGQRRSRSAIGGGGGAALSGDPGTSACLVDSAARPMARLRRNVRSRSVAHYPFRITPETCHLTQPLIGVLRNGTEQKSSRRD